MFCLRITPFSKQKSQYFRCFRYRWSLCIGKTIKITKLPTNLVPTDNGRWQSCTNIQDQIKNLEFRRHSEKKWGLLLTNRNKDLETRTTEIQHEDILVIIIHSFYRSDYSSFTVNKVLRHGASIIRHHILPLGELSESRNNDYKI